MPSKSIVPPLDRMVSASNTSVGPTSIDFPGPTSWEKRLASATPVTGVPDGSAKLAYARR